MFYKVVPDCAISGKSLQIEGTGKSVHIKDDCIYTKLDYISRFVGKFIALDNRLEEHWKCQA